MVHFVGAGPGAPDLITQRGAALLAQAEIVIYAGSLVNPALLGLCQEGCSLYDSAHMTLEGVLDVMKTDREIVRLHTGDPSLYGTIREQMDALDKWSTLCPESASRSLLPAWLDALRSRSGSLLPLWPLMEPLW